MKNNNEAGGKQYEIRELVIINFIEWYASEEKDRKPLRQAMQLYLQQELWVDFEGMKLSGLCKKLNDKQYSISNENKIKDQSNALKKIH